MLSSSVRTFHVPMVIGVTLSFVFVRPLLWDPRQPRYAGQGKVKQAMFRAPFLAPSSFYRGEQCNPEYGCSIAQEDAELHCFFGQ